MRSRACAVFASLLAAAGCGREQEPAARPTAVQAFVAEHDFGEIPHGEDRAADLAIPIPADGGPWIPVGFQRSCTCAQSEFLVVGPDGAERTVGRTGLADPADAVPKGGSLRMRLTIRTLEKEAADLPALWTPGQIVLQEATPAARRELLPVRFRFGIVAPVRLAPFAHLDVGEVPRPVHYGQSIEIHPTRRPLVLGTPRCVEAGPAGELREAGDVRVRIEAAEGFSLLHFDMQPGAGRPEGPFAMEILVPTDLPGDYVLRIPVSGSVVPDVQLSPPGWFSFGAFPFDEERECALMVTDYDPTRPADLFVVGLVDTNGVDVSEHFATHVDAVEGRVRSRTVHLVYRGTLKVRSFRGELLLAKDASGPPLLRIQFAGFDRK